jgi:hypothetical protein
MHITNSKGEVQTALQNADYNPERHLNDLLDAEQLVYLFNPNLCFLTGPSKAANSKEKQAPIASS